MKITITIEAEVSHVTGKFIAKDELADEITSELEGADPGSLYVEDSEYEIVDWNVSVA